MKSLVQSYWVVEAITYSFIKTYVECIKYFIPLHSVQTISLQYIALPQKAMKATDTFSPHLRKERKGWTEIPFTGRTTWMAVGRSNSAVE